MNQSISSSFPSSILKSKIFLAFLIYGIATGIVSYIAGYGNDPSLAMNLPGRETSRVIYSDVLVPYWKSTLEPSSYYEEAGRIDKTGKVRTTTKVPVYDYPIRQEDLFIPVSIVIWGLLGLVAAGLDQDLKRRQQEEKKKRRAFYIAEFVVSKLLLTFLLLNLLFIAALAVMYLYVQLI